MAVENVDRAIGHTMSSVFTEVRTEGTGSFFEKLWLNHQSVVIHLAKAVLMAAVIAFLAWLFSRICWKMITVTIRKMPALDESLGKILGNIVKTLIWVLAVLIILDLFGVNTASILTVLGAAGIAVGLAMKDSLSNIAAGLMLLFLRPYKVGDFIDCGKVCGTITEMGLFTTIVKTADGIFIAAPNSAIFGNPIKNFSRNPSRRADITVGIAYGDSLPKALEILRKMLSENQLIMKEPAPDVLVSDLADSSVNLTLRYWTRTEDYWKVYWDVKQRLKEVIEGAGLNIPFPQRVVTYVNAPGNVKAGEE